MDLYGKPCKRDWVAKLVFLIKSNANAAIAIATSEIYG